MFSAGVPLRLSTEGYGQDPGENRSAGSAGAGTIVDDPTEWARRLWGAVVADSQFLSEVGCYGCFGARFGEVRVNVSHRARERRANRVDVARGS